MCGGVLCYMASGFPPIAVTDGCAFLPSPHILGMTQCNVIYCQWFQFHTNITGPHVQI